MKLSPRILVPVKYGVVAGVLAFVLMITLYFLGRHPLMISPFLDFRIILYAVFLFFTLKEYRDFYNDGTLFFWQGLTTSTFMVFTASVAGAACLTVFGAVKKEFVSSYITLRTEYVKTFPEHEIKLIGKDVYEHYLSTLPGTTIYQLAQTYFMQGIFIGFFVSIILSVILRRQPQS